MINNLFSKTLLYVFLSLLFAGCSPAADFNPESILPQSAPTGIESESSIGDDDTKHNSEDVPMTPSPSDSEESGMQSLIDKAKANLAQRLAISLSQISLIEARAVEWPDASLGCPQPGMLYTQVPQDGALIILQVEEALYRYHSGGNREVFLCEQLFKDPDKPPPIDLQNLTPPTPSDGIPPGEGN